MKRSTLPVAALCALLGGAPALAADFSLMASYWDTNDAGDTAGGGFGLGFPINQIVSIELRATYFEELSDDPLRNAFDSDDPVFQDQGIQVLPVDAGVRLAFLPGAAVRPHLGAGATYFLLDSDFGNISDELGYYLTAGATFGDETGAELFAEAFWRSATAQLELDPEDLSDIGDLEIQSEADIDLDGLGINLGIRWVF